MGVGVHLLLLMHARPLLRRCRVAGSMMMVIERLGCKRRCIRTIDISILIRIIHLITFPVLATTALSSTSASTFSWVVVVLLLPLELHSSTIEALLVVLVIAGLWHRLLVRDGGHRYRWRLLGHLSMSLASTLTMATHCRLNVVVVLVIVATKVLLPLINKGATFVRKVVLLVFLYFLVTLLQWQFQVRHIFPQKVIHVPSEVAFLLLLMLVSSFALRLARRIQVRILLENIHEPAEEVIIELLLLLEITGRGCKAALATLSVDFDEHLCAFLDHVIGKLISDKLGKITELVADDLLNHNFDEAPFLASHAFLDDIAGKFVTTVLADFPSYVFVYLFEGLLPQFSLGIHGSLI